ncbi:MAG: hypothetical protein KGL74_12070, partial [Elusimicrobia bacterium]|nr:hypothetical protein [Elusimicrobiota bacterium]
PAASAWAWVAASGPLFLMLGRPPFDPQTSDALARFHLLPLLGAGLFVAAGVEALARRSPRWAAAAALLAAAVLIPGAARESRRGDFLAHDYGRTILRELPPGAVLAMDGGDDTFYSLSFLQFAQGLRPDVEMYDRGGVVFPGRYGADFRALPRELKEPRRNEIENLEAATGLLWYTTLNPRLLPGWNLPPAGLMRWPVRPGAVFALAAALDATMPMPRAPSAARRYRDRALLAFYGYQRGEEALADGDDRDGVSWLLTAADAGGDALWAAPAISYALSVAGYEAMRRGDFSSAERSYRAQAEVEPARAEPLCDVGVALQRAGRRKEAETSFREAVKREPRSPRPWETLGALLWAESRWPEAADAYASAAALPGGENDAAWAAKARSKAGR